MNGWTRYRDTPYSLPGDYGPRDIVRQGVGLLHAVPEGTKVALCGEVCAVVSVHPYPQAGSVCVPCARRAKEDDRSPGTSD